MKTASLSIIFLAICFTSCVIAGQNEKLIDRLQSEIINPTFIDIADITNLKEKAIADKISSQSHVSISFQFNLSVF